MKGLIFLGRSLQDLKNFAPAARYEVGVELRKVQRGRQPSDWKPMPVIGPGVCEIRVHEEGEWRAIYTAKFAEFVYVLHCFRKKTWQTQLADIRLSQQRYREIPDS